MIHKCSDAQRKTCGYGMWNLRAMQVLKGEAFRVYCYILKLSPDTELKPKILAHNLGISPATVMKVFRTLREQGFMSFDVNEFGRVPTTVNDYGQVVSQTTYQFFEIPELNEYKKQPRSETKPVQKENPFRNETRSESEQETRSESEQETRSESEQVKSTDMIARDLEKPNKKNQIEKNQEEGEEERADALPPSPSPKPVSRLSRKKQTAKTEPDAQEQPFGEFQRVFLTPDEHQHLLTYFAGNEQERDFWIAELDEYLETHPDMRFGGSAKAYARHYLTIRNWHRRTPDKWQKFKQAHQARAMPHPAYKSATPKTNANYQILQSW
jgi:biotin operon repressor